jgi:integrase
MRVQKLRPEHLAELYASLSKPRGTLSKRTVGHMHRVLHKALATAVTWSIVARNVASSVKPPPVDDTEVEIFTQSEIARVLGHFNGRPLRPIVSFLLGTGCRRGEALALRWKDVDFTTGIIQIERSVEQTAGGFRFKGPKTRHGRRGVTISPWLIAELKAHRTRQQEHRLQLGVGAAAADDLVFAAWDGSVLPPAGVSDAFRRAMKTLGIERTLHALRHTHVSQLIAAGVDVLTISRRIGHAKPSITLNVYSHLLPATDARAAEAIERAFGNIKEMK